MRTTEKNWFNTLNEALQSEGLVESWNYLNGISYGQTAQYCFENGSKYGHFVSIYRDERGMYERPVHYNC